MAKKYTLTKRWNNSKGEYAYILQEYSQREGGYLTNSWSGDFEWAGRIAEHYGIDVPKYADDEQPNDPQVEGGVPDDDSKGE